MKTLNRRSFVKTAAFVAAGFATPFVHSSKGAGKGKVVVIGGGFGGATTAKYIRKFDPSIEVTLIEPKKQYVTCPGSNWVLGGLKPLKEIVFTYDALAKNYGINVVSDWAVEVDSKGNRVRIKQGDWIPYDRLVVSPGIDFRWDSVEGLDEDTRIKMPHSYTANLNEFTDFHKRIVSLKAGATVIVAPPSNPFRCPPGPYERVSMLANYFKNNNPTAKILILDSKSKFSKQGLFEEGWSKNYGYKTDNSMIEWIPEAEGKVTAVDGQKMTVTAGEFDEVHTADLINLIPAQKAAALAVSAGLTDASGWCPVDHLTWESKLIPNVHVIGDASIGGKLPKSGFAANSEAKVCAAAVVQLLSGNKPQDATWTNTCYSLISQNYGVSVAMVYELNSAGTVGKVKGAGGLSPSNGSDRQHYQEAKYARNWYTNITKDIFS